MKDVAPSDELRRWFHARPALWSAFRKKYLTELANPEASRALEELYSLAGKKRQLTLVFAARDQEHNNAVILKQLLEGMRKPPIHIRAQGRRCDGDAGGTRTAAALSRGTASHRRQRAAAKLHPGVGSDSSHAESPRTGILAHHPA